MSCTFYLKDPLSPERKAVKDIEKDWPVEKLKEKSAETLEWPLDQLVFKGRIMREGKTLENYPLKDGSTIHVLRRQEQQKQDSEMSGRTEQESSDVPAPTQLELQAVVSEIVSDPGFLQYVIMNSAALSSDPQVQDLVRGSDFLERLGNPDEVMRILQSNRDLMIAARNALGSWLNMQEEGGIQESMEESRETHETPMEVSDTQEASQPMSVGGSQEITSIDLAAALATAQQSLSTERRAQRAARTRPRRPVVSSNLVSEAVAQAMYSTRRHPWEAQLVQLRAMGITDEAACIRALEETRGDVEAALNLLMR
eukprot:m.17709 g.17709  ORF g.17709 m.17709 type:complete len:312 (+) comp27540_c0_seq1:9-944(+)